MLKQIILFPFGGNAKESLISIFAINNIKKDWDIIGFVDDDRVNCGKSCCGVKVLGGREIIKKFPTTQILAVPGNPGNYLERRKIINSLKINNSHFATIIHPSATISCDSKIGYNTLLMSNVVVSCGVKIGNHCVILPNTVISHDTVIGDYSCIGSNVSISGSVGIGSDCFIGSGVKIREKISIGKRTLIGLGSNVIYDIKEGIVAVGNPARIIRKG